MDKLYISDTPAAVKNSKGLHLLTANTGNGQAVQIFLEELAREYGFSWTTTLVDIWSNEQKKEYKEENFGFDDELENIELFQWLFFWHGSGAPYQGQLIHFTKAAPEKIEYCGPLILIYISLYAITRFKNETLRVLGVLEIRLSGKYTGEPRDYLAGRGKGKYSIADIKTWPWISYWEMCGITKQEMEAFPHLLNWIDRIAQRPAVQIGTGPKYIPDST
ncbi:glutathione S-transferase [Hypoxylon sp. FL1857]|nr:glutathione S-transferase [Hypoxylon sp. FL1857]